MDDAGLSRQLARMLAPMSRRIMLMAARIVLTGATDKSPVQVVQFTGLADEVKQNVEYLQAFGHSSVPPAGARGLAIFPGGDRSHGVVIVLDARSLQPVTLKSGESLLWDALGKFIHLKDDGSIVIKADKVRVESPDFQVTGEVKDRCDADGKTMEEMRNTYNGHTHPGDSGGVTGPTGAVM